MCTSLGSTLGSSSSFSVQHGEAHVSPVFKNELCVWQVIQAELSTSSFPSDLDLKAQSCCHPTGKDIRHSIPPVFQEALGLARFLAGCIRNTRTQRKEDISPNQSVLSLRTMRNMITEVHKKERNNNF